LEAARFSFNKQCARQRLQTPLRERQVLEPCYVNTFMADVLTPADASNRSS